MIVLLHQSLLMDLFHLEKITNLLPFYGNQNKNFLHKFISQNHQTDESGQQIILNPSINLNASKEIF